MFSLKYSYRAVLKYLPADLENEEIEEMLR
jgi:hypothetical protein